LLYVFAALGLLFIVALIPLNLWHRHYRRSLSPDESLRLDHEMREDGRVW